MVQNRCCCCFQLKEAKSVSHIKELAAVSYGFTCKIARKLAAYFVVALRVREDA